MAKRQLIDTSAWIEYFRKDGDLEMRAAVKKAVREQTAAWCELTFLELMRGSAAQRKQASLIRDTFPCLSINQACWQKAYDIAVKASKAGKPCPNADILIYACSQVHGAEIIHRDRHFTILAEL